MGSTAAGALFLLFIAVVPAVLATRYQVGDTSGWASGVDYTTWPQGKTFRVGDTLEFTYDSSHSVSVVDAAGYASCDSTRAIQSFSGGETKITLTSVGYNYCWINFDLLGAQDILKQVGLRIR